MRFIRTLALAGLVVVTATACSDLDVLNLNNPDRERAISTPGDVESLIAGSYLTWFRGVREWAPGPALSVMADDHTASWGNFGMNDMSREPREKFNNDPSYSYAYVAARPWTFLYAALSATRDGLLAIDGGVEIGENGADTQRALALGAFVQGMVHGELALLYDQAFVLDVDTDLETAELVPYTEVMAASQAFLEKAISLANSNSFEMNPGWFGGKQVDNVRLAELAHSNLARFLASVPRDAGARAGANWSSIRSHLDAGITTAHFVTGTGSCDACWLDVTKAWGGTFGGWARVDLKTLGPADQSGAYQGWIATNVQLRNEILLSTPDARISTPDLDNLGDVQEDGLYFSFDGLGSSPFRSNRGTYHHSSYRASLFDEYAGNFQGEVIVLSLAELDFLRAEQEWRGGNLQAAIDLVNPYRTASSGLPALTVNGAEGAECVPRNGSTGACEGLWESIKYEKRMNTFHHGIGTAFYDDRGWGDLISGTMIHLPVPADELLVLLLDIYTFGGGGDGSAPAPGRDDFDLTSTSLTADQIRLRAEAMASFLKNKGVKLDFSVH